MTDIRRCVRDAGDAVQDALDLNAKYAETFPDTHREATRALKSALADIDAFAKQADPTNSPALFSLAHQTERKLLQALAPVIACAATPAATKLQVAAVEAATSHPDFAAQAASYALAGLTPVDRFAKVRQNVR